MIFSKYRHINVLHCVTIVYKGVVMVDTITIRLNKEESKVFKEYAELNNMPLSTLFKKTLEEKMEDEFDMSVIAAYEDSKTHETYTHEELKDTLGL